MEAELRTLADRNDVSDEIARIRRRLADLDAERTALVCELETLELEQKLISVAVQRAGRLSGCSCHQ